MERGGHPRPSVGALTKIPSRTDSMSVIADSQPGDEFVCIGGFHACPEGEDFRWKNSRKFRIGERVRYIDFFRNPNLLDNPVWLDGAGSTPPTAVSTPRRKPTS